ncbi:hypothetical protein ACW5XW_02825 [Aeromonas piscicola]|uniref:hypothetical protein n=1 Tax=Aeromonas piscicola TaxID=600645 RepID=UPI000A48F342|nr:hypothetical protein [Aeromonas piscicola]
MISKEQWKAIEEHLKAMWVDMKFDLHGHEIQIRRARKSESRTVLEVFIDGAIKGEWVQSVDKLDPADQFINQVVKQVWFHKFFAQYSAKQIAQLEKYKKQIGIKRFKAQWGDGDLKKQGCYYLMSHFGSAATLVRQFKKIEGLTLITPLE